MLGDPVWQAGVAELGTGTERECLGELQNLHENSARPIDIDRRLAWSQLQFQAAGSDQSRKRIRSWLALAPHIGVDD